jgi:thiamine biosynthesis protein ThiS
MQLLINGQEQTAPALGTIGDLARWLELPGFGSAIEWNGVVVRKADYEMTHLQDGDRLEVVRLVGGG